MSETMKDPIDDAKKPADPPAPIPSSEPKTECTEITMDTARSSPERELKSKESTDVTTETMRSSPEREVKSKECADVTTDVTTETVRSSPERELKSKECPDVTIETVRSSPEGELKSKESTGVTTETVHFSPERELMLEECADITTETVCSSPESELNSKECPDVTTETVRSSPERELKLKECTDVTTETVRSSPEHELKSKECTDVTTESLHSKEYTDVTTETVHSSPERELESKEPPAMIKLDDNTEAVDLLFYLNRMHVSVPPIDTETNVPEKSLQGESSKSPEKSLEIKESDENEKDKPPVSPVEFSGNVTEKVKKTVIIQPSEDVSEGASCKNLVLKPSPSVGTHLENLDQNISPGSRSDGQEVNGESGAMMEEAWERLKKSFVTFKGKPVGTLAALDPSTEALNYNQVFVRDFVPSGLACLMKEPPEPEIVKNFLLKTLHLQGCEKKIDSFTLGEGVLPASFKVSYDSHLKKDKMEADYGASAIGRVAPVDSGFWWIILLRSYTKCTRDHTLAEMPEVQKGMRLILNLCLADGFDTFPTLLCADGCSMIDRRMGIYGYPIEIQALFFFALRCARQMLKPERGGKELIERINKRITAFSFHIQNYYWLDFTQLNNIYRYKTEEYSHTAVNKFNVNPESIPDWVFDFMTKSGGYLIGNVSPARMDFRWFLVGNCIAILSSLATPAQATAIMELIEERWGDLIGEMPLKIAYPALEGHQWRIVTGCDPKNTRWSYHNGGSWPVLLWLLTAASIKTGRPQIAKRAIALVEQRLSKDGWPEYYDGKTGRYIGKQARKYQTWSIAGYLVAKMMIENPSHLLLVSFEEDKKMAKPKLTRSTSCMF